VCLAAAGRRLDATPEGGVMDKLSPLDALFVDAEDEDQHTSMAIASIAVFEGPPPCHEEFLAYLAGRLPLVPRYRQKLRTVPFRLGPPVWVDDPHFDLGYHVRRTALPGPGGDQQLAELMARVMSQRLDRDHPLWEYWVIEGLARGRWALISKVHHCMVDGVSGTDLYRVIFDFSPEPSPPAMDDRAVGAEPSPLELAARAALDNAVLPVRDALALTSAAANPGGAIQQAADMVRAMAKLAPALWPATGSSLSGPIGKGRHYTWARASLDDVKKIKRELGGTVNDVVLAAISGGFRALLLARGEQPEPHMVRSLVPVSVRAPGEESIYENRVSGVLADLPVHIADPAERLAAVRAELEALKASKEAMAGEALASLGRYSLYPVTSWWVRRAFGLRQREIVTVTTNVPGPGQPLYGMGRRLLEIIPYVPIATTVRTGISIFSYCGQLTFGITGDFAANPDLDVLARGIEHGMAELLTAARRHHRAAAARARRAATGAQSTATGAQSTATGAQSTATGARSTARGDRSTARGDRSPAGRLGIPAHEASPPACGSPPAQTRSRNSLISPVRRAGRTHSSAKVRVRISLASGSCRASRFASLKEWIRSIPCPRTSAGAVMARRWPMVGAMGPSSTPCSTAAVSSGSDAAALMNESSGPSPDGGSREAAQETSLSGTRA
jgi:WS/DGAT/MGAT family acyltransferase